MSALIMTFWNSFQEHEDSHKSDTFQPLFRKVLELCENGNEEIGYQMLWSGSAYSKEEAQLAQQAKNATCMNQLPDDDVRIDPQDCAAGLFSENAIGGQEAYIHELTGFTGLHNGSARSGA